VLEGDEVLADPQLQARGLFVEAEDPQRGRTVTHLLTPLRMGDTPLRPPPTLGQHSREILTEAGFSAEEVLKLGGG
jgi:crotonobetainyl-CoA:carnitine CoA-transferase CaiB-like acyl-CoA transferase